MSDEFCFEFGIPFPIFHTKYKFKPKLVISDPISLKKSTFNKTSTKTDFHGRLKTIGSNTYALYIANKSNLTIVGDHNIEVYLTSNILKIDSTLKLIYIKTRKYFLSYDYKEFRIWNLKVKDFCVVNEILYTIEEDNKIGVYDEYECVRRIEYEKKLRIIRGYEEKIIIVTQDHKVVLLNVHDLTINKIINNDIVYNNSITNINSQNELDNATNNDLDGSKKTNYNTTNSATIINDSINGIMIYNDEPMKNVEIYKNYIVIKTKTFLIVKDFINNKTQKIKSITTSKYQICNNLIILNYKRGAYKYYTIDNLENNKTVLYDEICGDIDVKDERIYVLTRSGIYTFCENREVNFVKINIVWDVRKFFNILFKKYKMTKKEHKDERIEGVENGVSGMIKEDLEGMIKKKNDKKEEKVTKIIKNKKKPRGGF
ncbi:WD40 repeat domain-containing protein [Vairimorpha necatrix]|uniref:WD40 repeat domain-containing protein n=1 Tax=Vairimorpha necatrix TaxID=6039 RepID=A0AAX4JFF4_9MICR